MRWRWYLVDVEAALDDGAHSTVVVAAWLLALVYPKAALHRGAVETPLLTGVTHFRDLPLVLVVAVKGRWFIQNLSDALHGRHHHAGFPAQQKLLFQALIPRVFFGKR